VESPDLNQKPKPAVTPGDVIREVAAKEGIPMVDVSAKPVDPADLKGLPKEKSGG
jgi:hypothetical protein